MTAAARDAKLTPRQIVDEQAEDDGLWFVAETITEDILQRALRRLHAAIEGDNAMADVIWPKTPPAPVADSKSQLFRRTVQQTGSPPASTSDIGTGGPLQEGAADSDATLTPAPVASDAPPFCFMHTLAEHPSGGLYCLTCGEKMPCQTCGGQMMIPVLRQDENGREGEDYQPCPSCAAPAPVASAAPTDLCAEVLRIADNLQTVWPDRVRECMHEAAAALREQQAQIEAARRGESIACDLLRARAKKAEARVHKLSNLLRESQVSIGGDWRDRRDAALAKVQR